MKIIGCDFHTRYQQIAMVDKSGDHLGTSREIVASGQTSACYDADFYPYGGEITHTNTCTQNYKFTSKERDTESGLDYFGARHYASANGRFMSADWTEDDDDPVPHADFTNPQSLNLYSYVRNAPLRVTDPDGHCCDAWDVIDFVTGLANAYSSDNLAGAGRQQQHTTAGQMGAVAGDAAATFEGGAKMLIGGAGDVTSVGEDATGFGALIGVPQAAISTALVVDGSVEAGQGAGHLITDPMQSSSGTAADTGTSKPHGNTAGDQPAELYEKYDANGNFEKHGVSQDASKRYSKQEIDGGSVKVTDRGSRKAMLAKERQKVETNPGPKNREPWAGKKKDAPTN